MEPGDMSCVVSLVTVVEVGVKELGDSDSGLPQFSVTFKLHWMSQTKSISTLKKKWKKWKKNSFGSVGLILTKPSGLWNSIRLICHLGPL